MFLSDKTIAQMYQEGKLKVNPFDTKNIRSAGIRVHLGKEILTYEADQKINPLKPESIRHKIIDLSENDFYIKPGQFVIGHTVEQIQTPRNIIGFLDGRSTIARLGLSTHITAAAIDGMYEEPRTITLEIKNNSNLQIKLTENLPIGMLLFAKLDAEVAQQVQEQYKNQKGITPPNLETQFE